MLLGVFRPQTTPEDKKVTNSERSASQMDRVTQRFGAKSNDLEDAYLADEVRGFSTTKPEYRIGISCPRSKGKTVAVRQMWLRW